MESSAKALRDITRGQGMDLSKNVHSTAGFTAQSLPCLNIRKKEKKKKNFKIFLAFWKTGKGENWSGLSQHSCKLELKCPEGRSSYKHTSHICPRPLGIRGAERFFLLAKHIPVALGRTRFPKYNLFTLSRPSFYFDNHLNLGKLFIS